MSLLDSTCINATAVVTQRICTWAGYDYSVSVAQSDLDSGAWWWGQVIWYWVRSCYEMRLERAFGLGYPSVWTVTETTVETETLAYGDTNGSSANFLYWCCALLANWLGWCIDVIGIQIFGADSWSQITAITKFAFCLGSLCLLAMFFDRLCRPLIWLSWLLARGIF